MARRIRHKVCRRADGRWSRCHGRMHRLARSRASGNGYHGFGGTASRGVGRCKKWSKGRTRCMKRARRRG